jgi:hypothetical protein
MCGLVASRVIAPPANPVPVLSGGPKGLEFAKTRLAEAAAHESLTVPEHWPVSLATAEPLASNHE